MRRFSIGTSLGDAFGLIRRRPLAVFVWGALMIAPLLAAMAVMLPAMSAMVVMSTDAHEAPNGPPPEFLAQMMQLQLASMLANVGQLLLMAVVYTAVMRAVVRPAEASAFSLRVGMDELRVAVVGLVIGVGLYVLMMIVAMLGVGAGLAFWGLGAEPGPGLAVVALLLIPVLLAFVWALARVSLMAPATVLYRDFAFAQGWRLARGKGWTLVGMMILVFLIILLIEAVLVLAGLAVAIGAVGVGVDWSVPEAANPAVFVQDWLSAYWYWAVLAAIAAAAFYGVVATLSVAPFASACRQLAAGGRGEDAAGPA
jgi:hypothetical protein